jgi:glycosyltransferase involved in cell wall biosynthesis
METFLIMSQNKVLSVIIPVRGFKRNKETLEFIFSNSNKDNLQLIVVLDEVDDIEAREIRAMLDKHSPINAKLLRGKFNCPGLARNAGLEHASGDWITFWDADDFPEVDNIIEALSRAKAGILIGKYRKKCGNLITLPKSQKILLPRFIKILWLASEVGIWRIVFSAELLERQRFSSIKMGEDQAFFFKLKKSIRDIEFSNEIFYTYRVHSQGSLTSSRRMIEELEMNAVDMIMELPNKNLFNFTINSIGIIRQVLTIMKSISIVRGVQVLSIFPRNYLRMMRR